MRRNTIWFLWLLLLFTVAKGQQGPKLYYYTTADHSLLGVKDEYGTVIIPATFLNVMSIEDHTLLEGPTIEFPYGSPSTLPVYKDLSRPATAVGAIYSRQGEFLYQAQLFDNGPDYWEEGLRRYVEQDKMGYVDLLGNKVTAAAWDFVYPFNYGYAEVMLGKLKKVYDQGGEHWTIGSEGPVVHYLINKKGERVHPYAVARHPKDYFYEGQYYPYPFVYTVEEQAILSRLQADSVGVAFLFDSSSYRSGYDTSVQMEITARPNDYNPYYVVKVYNQQQSIGFGDFIYVDALTLEPSVDQYTDANVPLQEAMVAALTAFVADKGKEIPARHKEAAVKELLRLAKKASATAITAQ